MIFNKDLNEFHPFGHNYETNSYYTRFANKLLRKLEGLNLEGFKPSELKELAVRLTLYFEDVVADSGQWRMFSHKCEQLYGFPVPIYHDEGEDYYVDEPSTDAVSYLVWQAACEDRTMPFADHPLYGRIALTAYELMDEAFEEAPVNERLADDVREMMTISTHDFNQLRTTLVWIAKGCYCTSGEEFDAAIDESVEKYSSFYNGNVDLLSYTAITAYIFVEPTGPLALTCVEWLKAFYEGHEKKGEILLLDQIELTGLKNWQVERVDNQVVSLRSADEKSIEVTYKNLNLSPSEIGVGKIVLAGFVKFRNEWQLNGSLVFLDRAESFEPFREDERKAERQRKHNREIAERLAQAAKGQRMVYFETLKDLDDFMRQALPDEKVLLDKLANPQSGNHPVMFFYGEGDGLSFVALSNLAQFINAPGNPYYDKYADEQDAVSMLMSYKNIPSRLMSELIAGDYIPALLNSKLVSKSSTVEQRRHDLDFILRIVRRNHY